MDSIVKWVTDKFGKDMNILDLGSGNGVLLIQLVSIVLQSHNFASVATDIKNSH